LFACADGGGPDDAIMQGGLGAQGGQQPQSPAAGSMTGMGTPIGSPSSMSGVTPMPTGASAPAPGAGAMGTAGMSAQPGNGSMPPLTGAAGMGAAGMDPEAGAGMGGPQPTAGTGSMPMGSCCADGDCLCHGPDPSGLTSSDGSFDTDSYDLSTGIVYYPTDAEPPFAAVAICAGFLNTGIEMLSWGSFYASHGIVTIVVGTLPTDIPEIRAIKLLAAVEELKGENTRADSQLSGKLAGRYGTSGYSMGGGGTTIASAEDPTLMTSVGLAAWAPVGAGIQVPTLLLCGSSDGVAPCSMSQSSYRGIPETTPKMMVTISGASHLAWFGPTDAGQGASGAAALAFQKVYLEGDERWKPLLGEVSGSVTTNIR
jgi:dienelactone hydrolase